MQIARGGTTSPWPESCAAHLEACKAATACLALVVISRRTLDGTRQLPRRRARKDLL